MAVFHWGPSLSLCGSSLELLCSPCILLWGPVGLACSSATPVSTTSLTIVLGERVTSQEHLATNECEKRKQGSCGLDLIMSTIENIVSVFQLTGWDVCHMYWEKKQATHVSQGYWLYFSFTHSFRLKVNVISSISLSLNFFYYLLTGIFCQQWKAVDFLSIYFIGYLSLITLYFNGEMTCEMC